MHGLEMAARERIGISATFHLGEATRLGAAADLLRGLGARHLRLVMRAEHGDWNVAQLRTLGRDFAVLAALRTLPDVAGETERLVAKLLDTGLAAGLELDLSSPRQALREAVAAAERRGVPISLLAAPGELARMDAMVIEAAQSVTLCCLADEAPELRDQAIAALRDALPAKQLCLVAGYSTWRQDPFRQIAAFRQALAAPAARVYWHALQDAADDAPEARHDPRLAHLGLHTAVGTPKLLARLLAEGGVAAVERVAQLGQPAPALATVKPVLVTGGAGFIGSNLANRLAESGHDVLVLDALARPGVDANLAWLRRRHPRRIAVAVADLRDRHALREAAARAQVAFHMAAQVAVTTSMVDPESDFDINLRGTLNLIDALRHQPSPAPIVFASTNKVYGDLADVGVEEIDGAYQPLDPAIRAHGIGESRPLSFHTPYGCSKGGADQYVLDTARSFGVPSAVFRMSCIYGPRQMGTEDQGWLAHFLISVIDGKPITLYGDGKQVRDALYVEDAVSAYLAAWKAIGRISGQAFNLGGGPENAVTLRQVIAEIERLTRRRADIRYADWRPGDQRYFVADSRRAIAELELEQPLGWREGLALLARWLQDQRQDTAPVEPELALGNAG